MNIESLRTYCLSKPAATEGFPFGETVLVFKAVKMFALMSMESPFTINLKCDPEKAIELREQYEEIIPGFHMNKRHWNTVDLEGSLSDQLIYELIDHSYELIINSLSKKERQNNGNL
jgi:predicted DNA-binding protein (MmcQ/YjbR family)